MDLGEVCPNCGCFHDETYADHFPVRAEILRSLCLFFDPSFLCIKCKKPVEKMSTCGPAICRECSYTKNRKSEGR